MVKRTYIYSIKRLIEGVVERRAKTTKAILLTGPRQVGKSTLFQHLFANANQVTFDDDLTLAQAETDTGLFLMNNPIPLMIDEVQIWLQNLMFWMEYRTKSRAWVQFSV